MMSIFIYEHITSGALSAEQLSDSLMHEGNMMINALCQDLLALGHSLTIIREASLPHLFDDDKRLTTIYVSDLAEFTKSWQQCQQTFNQFIIIAPETANTLANIVANLRQNGKHVFGCSPEAISLFTDKYQTFKHLKSHQIATPQTFTVEQWLNEINSDEQQRWISKYRDGAGCEQTFIQTSTQLRHFLSNLSSSILSNTIIQPYIDSQSLSLSLFITAEDIHLLSVNIQHMQQQQNQLHLKYCEVKRNDLIDTDVAIDLAKKLHQSTAGLYGFVGVDLLKTENQLYIVDINPRLTSSYAEAGMRHYGNPALLLHQEILKTFADNDRF
ncbi:hypothetical protein LCGC14_0633000 [marine sediment metagenome]|uniref:ATP-grasp domain-containing protein n=1 Tax=marine sediment metagenome TaxID=412755 RepID=A0A0F9R6P4_9ZZZZ